MEGSQYLNTPPSSEQDGSDVQPMTRYEGNPYNLTEAFMEEDFPEGEDEVVEERKPRKQPRVAAKSPLMSKERFDREEWEDVPDLAAYFSFFYDFDEAAQVKYCRAYANALSAKNPKQNRLRYSHKKPQ